MPRGACLTWPADYAYGYNGSYRRELPQPIDGPSACVLKVVGRRTHTSDLAADCQQPLSLPNTMVTDRLYGGARVTPDFSAATKSIGRWKEISYNALAHLPGLHTCSGTRRAQEVEAKNWRRSLSMPLGDSTQSSSR